jgi:hypothetical protein
MESAPASRPHPPHLAPRPGHQRRAGLQWGAADPLVRGPVVGTTANRSQRNVVGTHSGSYGVYRALAVAAGNLTRGHRADLTNTAPTDLVGPYPQWGDARQDRLHRPLGRQRAAACTPSTWRRATTSAPPSR